ncbi:MAG TPA: hypothetical protein VGV61_15890, partial [Thermoanaerobaculia bacterium]|nr:hypothetical protein [Thermoanaerobaculia bacterium]
GGGIQLLLDLIAELLGGHGCSPLGVAVSGSRPVAPQRGLPRRGNFTPHCGNVKGFMPRRGKAPSGSAAGR